MYVHFIFRANQGNGLEQQFLFTLLNFTLIWILYVGVTPK